MSRKRLLWAAPLLVLLFVFSILRPDSANAPFLEPAQLIANNVTDHRPLQAVYQAETVAAKNGWDAHLAQVAGDSWRDLGDVETAVAYWETALDFAPEDAVLARKLAEAYIHLERWPAASDALQHLLSLQPVDSWANYQLGLILATFNSAQSERYLQSAASNAIFRTIAIRLAAEVGKSPASPEHALRVGILLAEYELWPYAELALRQAAETGYPFPEAEAYLGLARDKQGKDGWEQIERAVSLSPDSATVRFLQGLHLRLIADDAGSLAAFQIAMGLAPDNPAFAAELGTAYQLVGDLELAAHWLETAVVLSAGDERFQKLLDDFTAQQTVSPEDLIALGLLPQTTPEAAPESE